MTHLRAIASVIVAIGVMLAALPGPASAVTPSEAQVEDVEFVPVDGSRFEIRDRVYGGTIVVRSVSDGLFLGEIVGLDDYLAGIREVPYSWPMESLAAQVVAARTYLAYQLGGGRSGREAEYGYDICATSACQVYAGAGVVDAEGGDRWLEAVDRTRGEILMWNGRPAETVFSSSAGSRTRANQDIWGGAPVPYLQPVDSPEEGVSPWAEWSFGVDPEAFVEILHADGYDVSGRLRGIRVDDPGEGNGPVELIVDTDGGSVRISATKLKGAMNREADRLYPGAFPARREDGKRLPQSLPSYTYEIEFDRGVGTDAERFLPSDRDIPRPVVRIEGEGWGHGVGLSQWGARAMAEQGADYREILAHYYGGLEPVDGGEFVPDRVVVGLGWGKALISVEATGPFELRINGRPSGTVMTTGTWTFLDGGDRIIVIPPIPLLEQLRSFLTGWWPR